MGLFVMWLSCVCFFIGKMLFENFVCVGGELSMVGVVGNMKKELLVILEKETKINDDSEN